jgi:Zn-dependent protease with chaperone function
MNRGPSLGIRVALAVALTIGFYAVALGLAGAFGFAIWFDLTESPRVHGRLLIGGGIVIAVVLWSVAPRIDRFRDPGIRLHGDRQPRLFALIDEVAAAARQAPPAEVFLVDDVNAFVAQRGGMMGIGSRRVMGIGLPLLQVLTVAQLRAVLAHEFGHFHGGDTQLGPWIHRTRAAIVRTVGNFARVGSWLHYPFQWYAKLFLRITQAVSRRQELAADALSVTIAGESAVCGALTTVSETAPLYQLYLREDFVNLLNGGLRAPLADGFARFLASPGAQRARTSIGEEARRAKADPYDTHPPLGERLAAAKACADRPAAPRRADDGGPAISLVADLPQLERELVQVLVGDPEVGELPTTDWQKGPATVYPKVWQRVAHERSAVLPPLGIADFAAQATRLDALGEVVKLGDTPERRRETAAWILGALLAHRLHEHGFAVHAGPGHPIELRRGDAVVRPFEVLQTEAEGHFDDARWRAFCSEQGIGELALTGQAVPTVSSGIHT